MRGGLSSRVCQTVAALALLVAASTSSAADAKQLLGQGGFDGGLIVHVGCGDGKLTAELAKAAPKAIIQGFAAADALATPRGALRAASVADRAAVCAWDGQALPLTGNLANLLILSSPATLDRAEAMRVLAPGGSALIRTPSGWRRLAKPRPEAMDDWGQFLHDATNNAVSSDALVGPPARAQWVAEPRAARSHEHLATVSSVLTAGGRIVAIQDEGPTASVDLPPDWYLVARDAFNGLELWRRRMGPWESAHRGFRSGPAELPRRLVVTADHVYATLGYGKPVEQLDAATGKTVRTFTGTENAAEMVYADDVLYCVVADPEKKKRDDWPAVAGPSAPLRNHRIVAVDTATGRALWQVGGEKTHELMPLTLTVAAGKVFYQTPREFVSLSADDGSRRWAKEVASGVKRKGWSTPTVVVVDGVVISADREAGKDAAKEGDAVTWIPSSRGGGDRGVMRAWDAETGRRLWQRPCKQGYNFPPDVLVVDGEVWSGQLIRKNEPGFSDVVDLKTGRTAREIPRDLSFIPVGMGHHRCYRNKATERYILSGRAGIETVDVTTGEAIGHNWVRGTCAYGILPGNGLIYAPPHSCACFLPAKINGFWALGSEENDPAPVESQATLRPGPAYGNVEIETASPSDWPTYRRDSLRSGLADCDLSAELVEDWRAQLGGDLTPVTVANGRLFVADEATRTLYALEAETGKVLWRYVTDAAVDTPPTLHAGLAIVGSTDGWVYCLRAADGKLVYRLRVAPASRWIMSYGRLESAWPVAGAVLVMDGAAYAAAGRCSYMDGGVWLTKFAPATGEVLARRRIFTPDPESGRQPDPRGFEIAGVGSDVLSGRDGKVFLQDVVLSAETLKDLPAENHLFSPTGFRDKTWWHRTYWIYGPEYRAGWGGWWQAGNLYPSGRLLVIGRDRIYGFGRSFYPKGNAGQWNRREAYRFYSTSAESEKWKADQEGEEGEKKKRRRRFRAPQRPRYPQIWSTPADGEARALVVGGDVVLAAGPLGQTHKSLEAFRGEEGIALWVLDRGTGKLLKTHTLEAMPVFDGLAAADRHAYLSCRDGTVRCYRSAQ